MKLDELLPLLFQAYRQLAKEPGAMDRLQTREFRTVAASVQAGKEHDPYAYLLYYFPVRYQEGLSLIGECATVPNRVLDVGSRMGPFALAALEKGASEVIMVDEDEKWLEIGAEIIGRMGYPVSTRIWNPERPIQVQGKFDLIICAYPQSPLKDEFVHYLVNMLTPNGQVLLVDSSQEGINREFLQRRDRLVKAGYPIQAPCVWQGECVALKAKAPCYAQRALVKAPILRDLQRAAGINLSSLKMSYLLVRRKDVSWPAVIPCSRVISPPMETVQGERYYLCGTEGRTTLGTTLKVHPKASRAYEYLKRGELIAIEGATVNKSALEIVESTIIKVVAPVGLPLPIVES